MTGRSLLPREHGAYVQLLAPLVAAFVTFGVTPAAGLVALGACVAFCANEPLLVVLGHRGKRALANDGARARRRLFVLVPAAALAGISGLALAPEALDLAVLVAAPALVVGALAWKKRMHTLAGELVAAVAVVGASAPVAVAAGASDRVALWLWAAWSLGYAFTVVAVHRVIARHKKRATYVDALAIVAALAATGGALALGMYLALPLAGCSLVLLVAAPSAKHLRAIGFVLVAASAASVALCAALA